MAGPLDWLQQLLGGDQSYDTRLSPAEEQAFAAWKQQHAPQDSGADYDLRGAFRAGLQPDPATQHWPDTFKKPNHPTFSNQSMYATGPTAAKAGRWEGERFIPPDQPPPYEPPPRLPGFGQQSYSQEDALGALYNLTGLPDVQQGWRAAQRGEYLPALGQGGAGLAALATMLAPGARMGVGVAREAFGAVPGVLGDTTGAIKAYHGSPYDFERFDMSKIGTGEGAQAYGHGLYFAENPETAQIGNYETSAGALARGNKAVMPDVGEKLAAMRSLDPEKLIGPKQTSNYVVFDDKLIDILRKYGIVPPLAAGAGTGLLGSGSEPPT